MLELRQIQHHYDGHRVLHGLTLLLQQGQIGCLLGGSGCGKTTALRCIAGFESIDEGEIILAGKIVSRKGYLLPPQQRKIGMVFQDYALFPHLTVQRNVEFGLQAVPSAARRQRASECLALVGLDAVAQRYPHQLSGGQQQRVALARALAPRPSVLLLDEPFSNLDVELREHLGREVRTILKAAGTTAMLVTHDQREAFAIADLIGVMAAGQIRQWASPYLLYHQPIDRFVADFIGEGVLLPGEMLASGQVAIELGAILPDRCPATVRKGERVVVLLRPDDVIHDDASALKAKVVDKAFRGAQFLYTLALESGQQVLSLVPSHHDHAIGELIGIRLEVDHLVVFPAA